MATPDLLTALRDTNPIVHCITNYVSMNIAANVILAAGASPAMVHAHEEIEDFTPLCNAVSINIGTLSVPWLASMTTAAQVANNHDIPWILDPVAHFISQFRRQAAQDLLNLRPTVVRGNASEILALAGEQGTGKGADAGDPVEAAHTAGQSLARQYDMVVAITGPTDYVTDGSKEIHISGGSEIMPRVTALGCALSALIAAYTAIGPRLDATVTALAHFKTAGTLAGQKANGPGSFESHFLDALSTLKDDNLTGVIA